MHIKHRPRRLPEAEVEDLERHGVLREREELGLDELPELVVQQLVIREPGLQKRMQVEIEFRTYLNVRTYTAP